MQRTKLNRSNNQSSGFAHLILPVIVAVVIAVLGGVIYDEVSKAATPSDADYFQSGITGKCLDDRYDAKANYTSVQLYTCNKSSAQQWTVNGNGTIENANGSCLDLSHAQAVNNTKLVVYTCNSNPAQQWKIIDNTLVNPAFSKCIDDPYSNATNGTQLILYTCKGTKNQIWTAVSANLSSGSTTTGSNPKVPVSTVFVPYSSTSNGPTKMQGFAVIGADFVAHPTSELTQMQELFPGIDSIRIAIGTSTNNVVPSVSETSLIAAVNTAVATIPNIQIVLDDHQHEGGQQVGNTTADLNLYTQWANDFKNNQHVSFNTPNEPGGNSTTINTEEAQAYTTIRATGAQNRIWLEDGGVFPTATQSSIDSTKMINIGMDTHFYPRTSSGSATNDYNTDGAIGIKDSLGTPLQQAAFEFGPSVSGPSSGDLSNSTAYVGQVVSLADTGKLVMTDAWVWSNGGSMNGFQDLIVDENGVEGQFGKVLQQDDFAQ
jgi:hypothetical protein